MSEVDCQSEHRSETASSESEGSVGDEAQGGQLHEDVEEPATEASDAKPPSDEKRALGLASKRYKYDPTGTTDFAVSMHPCLTGRYLKAPMVLTILGEAELKLLTANAGATYESPTTLVRFGYREAWISSVCAGRLYGGRLLDQAYKEIRHELQRALDAAAKSEEIASRSTSTVEAGKCRSFLGLDDDDSENEVETEDVEAEARDSIGLVEVDFHGLVFKAARCKRVLYVEGTMAVLQTLCSACLDKVADILTKQTAIVVARPTTAAVIADCPEVLRGNKCVQWMAASKTFQVTYQSTDGERHRSVKGLGFVPKKP